jgi:hypothetical protein
MLLAVSAWAQQQPGQIDQEIIDWINNNAHPLKTTDPNATLDDLGPLETNCFPACDAAIS